MDGRTGFLSMDFERGEGVMGSSCCKKDDDDDKGLLNHLPAASQKALNAFPLGIA